MNAPRSGTAGQKCAIAAAKTRKRAAAIVSAAMMGELTDLTGHLLQ